MQLANKIQKKCPVIFGYTLYTTVPVVIIECPVQLTGFLKSLRCIWMRDVWFQILLVGLECLRRLLPAKGARSRASPSAITWTPPSPANHNIQGSRSPALPERKGRTQNISVFQALPLLIVFGKSFFFFFFFGSTHLLMFICVGHGKSLSVCIIRVEGHLVMFELF